MTPLADLKIGAPHEPIVRFGMRSFDRQWTFRDPRLAKTESPSLWASLSDKQVFLTTMTTSSLGGGPAATLTTAVPDKHHFRGSYGGKDVIPLYRDANGTPNADRAALKVLRQQLDTNVTIEHLFAYTFGVLAGTDYTERFREALETPGPRVPLTSRPRALPADGGPRPEIDLASDVRRALWRRRPAGLGHPVEDGTLPPARWRRRTSSTTPQWRRCRSQTAS